MTVVYQGSILTVDANDSQVRYLVEERGKIAYVGNDLPQKYQSCKKVELGSRALAPSFVDTHIHLASFATFHAGLNVMDARSNDEILDMIAQFKNDGASDVLIAFGVSRHAVAEGRLLSREELDRVCSDRPMMMVKYDGHACVVNSRLLELLRGELGGMRGYHPETGEMNQEAFFAISHYVSNSISIPELVGNIQSAVDYLASRGIGMAHTVSGVGFPRDLDISLEKWLAKSMQHGFQVRVFPQSMDVTTALRRRIPRIGGCFATALDGCFGSKDAALLQPYCTLGDGSGVLYYDDATVEKFCIEAHKANLQIEMHAIGDAAFEQALRSLERALEYWPRSDARHGIIHACLPTDEGIGKAAELGIHFPMQTSFIDWRQEPDSYLEEILGPARAAKLNPLRTMWDAGITISAGSDAPCTDPDPVMWMHKACNHTTSGQSLAPREALRMCTYNGAWTTYDDDARGSLEVGKVADMVILSHNPYDLEPSQMNDMKVERLMLKGAPYKPQSQSFASAILMGLIGTGYC